MTNGASLYSACHQNMHPCQPPRIPRPEQLVEQLSLSDDADWRRRAAAASTAPGHGAGYHGDPAHVSSVSLPDIWRVYRGGEKFQ